MKTPDVVILGAGVIGLSLARECAARGLSVCVVTRDAPGAGASSASAGMLEVHYPLDKPAALAALCMDSVARYPGFVEALRAETGLDCALDPCGTLVLAADAAERARLEREAAAIPGSRFLPRPADWRALEPELPESLAAALWLPDDHHVDARRLGTALVLSLERRGVPIRRGVTVTGLRTAAGRAVGLATSAGPIDGGAVVIAAGAWAGRLGGLPVPLPVRPVRGQLVVLAADRAPRKVLQAARRYLVPRPHDGQILVGATVEEAGFDAVPTADGVRSMLAAAVELCPALAAARFVEARVGLRPATPDELPILGAGGLPGLWLAAGLFRKGVLLAPGTAGLLADVIGGAAASPLLAPCAVTRFAAARA